MDALLGSEKSKTEPVKKTTRRLAHPSKNGRGIVILNTFCCVRYKNNAGSMFCFVCGLEHEAKT